MDEQGCSDDGQYNGIKKMCGRGRGSGGLGGATLDALTPCTTIIVFCTYSPCMLCVRPSGRFVVGRVLLCSYVNVLNEHTHTDRRPGKHSIAADFHDVDDGVHGDGGHVTLPMRVRTNVYIYVYMSSMDI